MQRGLDERKATTALLVRRPTITLSSSAVLGWNAITIEHHRAGPGERLRAKIDRLLIKLICGERVTHAEHLNQFGRPTPHVKVPGAIFLYPEGVLPFVRQSTETELIMCSLDQEFVRTVQAELGGKYVVNASGPNGFHDDAMSSLLNLLKEEAKAGGQSGQLYADHLTYALTVRLLTRERPTTEFRRCDRALPSSRLRRVVEFMEAELSAQLDLNALAIQSGYSRNHFLRMFRGATGHTPHQFLLRLRVKRAQAMMRNKSVNLVDVAVECGFSSHAHLSRVFRQLTGVTPSEYRRNIL